MSPAPVVTAAGITLSPRHELTARFLVLRACARFGQPPEWADSVPPHVVNEAIAFELLEMELGRRRD